MTRKDYFVQCFSDKSNALKLFTWQCVYVTVATPLPIRQQIVKHRQKDNSSIRAIANIVKKSKGVIRGILKVYDDTGSCEAGMSTGRPRKTSERDDRTIAKIVKADSIKTAAVVSREFNAIMKKNCNSSCTLSEDKWQTMHFSDESEFNLLESEGGKYVRRGVGETSSPKCRKRHGLGNDIF